MTRTCTKPSYPLGMSSLQKFSLTNKQILASASVSCFSFVYINVEFCHVLNTGQVGLGVRSWPSNRTNA